MNRMSRAALALTLTLGVAGSAFAQETPVLTLGVLKFGTVNWELDVIERHGLDEAEGFELEVVGFGGGDASNVALLGGEVDGIVDDWLWVSRLRADGEPMVFLPYSASVGALMVREEDGIASYADFEGKTIGVAGGPLDKSWLMMQAAALESEGVDLAAIAEPAYGAPPLLQEKFVSGELDAVLNYWHFAARLEAQGFVRFADVSAAIELLGGSSATPQLGYVFKEDFAQENPDLLAGFINASRAAKAIMAESDEEWETLRERARAEDDATLEALKRRYREGIVTRWGDEERADAARLYAILAGLGGEDLVGPGEELAPGVFWDGARF